MACLQFFDEKNSAWKAFAGRCTFKIFDPERLILRCFSRKEFKKYQRTS